MNMFKRQQHFAFLVQCKYKQNKVQFNPISFDVLFFANVDAIIQSIIEYGFEVRYMKSYTFRLDEVESLFIKYRNKDFFRALIEAYTT